MPNANVLKQKQEQVAALAEKMKNSAAGVLVDYRGITVADDTKLRRELREAGVEYAIRAGYMDGKVLDEAGVIAVAKLPGKQELLTMLCMALNGNIRGLAVALDAIREKKEGEAA